MKSNSQYIFDKIMRSAATDAACAQMDRAALIDLIAAIGAADRGVALTGDQADVIAQAILAARGGNPAELRRVRAALDHACPQFASASGAAPAA